MYYVYCILRVYMYITHIHSEKEEDGTTIGEKQRMKTTTREEQRIKTTSKKGDSNYNQRRRDDHNHNLTESTVWVCVCVWMCVLELVTAPDVMWLVDDVLQQFAEVQGQPADSEHHHQREHRLRHLPSLQRDIYRYMFIISNITTRESTFHSHLSSLWIYG